MSFRFGLGEKVRAPKCPRHSEHTGRIHSQTRTLRGTWASVKFSDNQIVNYNELELESVEARTQIAERP